MSDNVNPTPAAPKSTAPVSTKINFKNMWNFLKKTITNPTEALTKDIDGFADIKNSAILAGVVALIGALINVITAMIVALNSSRVVKSLFGSSKTVKEGLNWDALGSIEYGSIIFKAILAYGLIMAIGAGVYFIASSVVKKQANFSKLLAVVSIALLFYLVLSQIVGTLIMKLSVQVGMFVAKIGLIYALVLAYEGLNFQIFGDKKDQTKIFFNIASLAVIAVVFYYINRELMTGVTASNVMDGLDSLKSLEKLLK